MYDKMTTVRQAELPGGGALPLSLSRETFREYFARTVEVDRTAAQSLLEEELEKQLKALIGEDGQVEDTRFSAKISGGRLEVTLTAQCLEEIGEEQPGTWELPENP